MTASAWRISGRGFRAQIPVAVFPSLHTGGTRETRHQYYRWHLQGVPMPAPWRSPQCGPASSHPRGLQGREPGTALREQTAAKAPAPLTAPNEDVIVSTLGKAVWFGSARQSWSERLRRCPCQVATWSSHVHGHHRPCGEDGELWWHHVLHTLSLLQEHFNTLLQVRYSSNFMNFVEKMHRRGRGARPLLGWFCGL